MDLLIQIRKEIDVKACCTAWCTDVKKFNILLPCCGYSLPNALVAIAIMDVIGAVLAILPLIILLVSVTVFRDVMNSIREDLTMLPMDSAKTVDQSFSVFLTVLTLVISIALLEFYLAMLLLNAQKKKKITSCYKWWRLVVVVLIVILFIFALYIIESYRILVFLLGVAICGYKIYTFWVVSLFVDTIGVVQESDYNLPTVCSDMENYTFTQI